ncbi:hypothetical protein JRI60_50070 [Archangium violaceum]|uniref:hypothetical protein n=1 Tax=Archangium violaceum TaxID=83451 RepID=UPI00194E4DAD|nr:hypothetical protein [Archangium violaceum]QRN97021.1 hypothetical protein JRI60_50070 [Archangium violaceum]
MTKWKTETATVDLRELDMSELERVRGGSADDVLLNPQPLPPRATSDRSLFSRVTLNPQPEPPGILFSRVRSLSQ